MSQPLPAPQPFLHLANAAVASPNAIALCSTSLSLSYEQFRAHAVRMAQQLSANGVQAGDRVLVRAPNDLQAIIAAALWALRAVGGVLPSASSWASLPPIEWLISTDQVDGFKAEQILLDDAFLAETLTRTGPFELEAYESLDAPCRLLFSSGTTGSPVAIELSVRSLQGRCEFLERNWMPARPYFSLIPLAGSFGVYALINAMATHSTYLVPGTPKENLALIKAEFVACVVGSVAQLEALCDEATPAAGDLKDLAMIYPTGTTMPPSLEQRLRALSTAEIQSAYGATELGPIATGTFDPDGVLRFTQPHTHVDMQVVDDAGLPLSSGRQGLLRIRTDTMVDTYVGAAVRGDAFNDGWFYPGDLATVASDGSFVLNGRATEVANIGGVKVDPTLVDEAARSIEGIDDAALFTTEGPNGTEAILAVVCPDETLALAALAAARSAAFGMVIETVWRVPALPRTEHGKLRRREVAVQWETERSETRPGDRTL